VCFAHGGGSFPGTIGRIQHGWDVRPDLCAKETSLSPTEHCGKFWADSLVHDAAALDSVVRVFGADKVCLGSDYPFPLGEFTAESRGMDYCAGACCGRAGGRGCGAVGGRARQRTVLGAPAGLAAASSRRLVWVCRMTTTASSSIRPLLPVRARRRLPRAGQLIDSMPWDEGLRDKVLGANACAWMGGKWDEQYFWR